MKRTTAIALASLAGLALFGGLARSAPAHAAPSCAMPTGWYANADEQTRLPAATEGGLKFSGNDLIHHHTLTTVENLTHGTFVASPAPDQPSFFSVEVFGSDGGYGTLRWNTTTSKWNLVTGGVFYENADPAALVDMPPVHRSHYVISFGVGYTANPPGTVDTTVSSVTFAGHTYDLSCTAVALPPTPSTKPTATVTPSATPTATPTAPATTVTPTKPPTATATPTRATPQPTSSTGIPVISGIGGPVNPAADSLPITGPNVWYLVGFAALALGLGLAAIMLVVRRRQRFVA